MTDRRPVVVLLPPLGCDGAFYAPLAQRLAPVARVVSVDHPAFGDDDADVFGGGGAEELEEFEGLVRATAARIGALGVTPAILGGVSLGGTLSLALAEALAPRGLLLASPGGLPVAEARKGAIRAAMAEERTPEAFARRSLGIDATDFDASGFARHFAEGPELDPPRARARAYFEHLVTRTWSHERAPRRALAYAAMLRAATKVDLTEALRANRTPTSLVWGDSDRVFSARVASRYARTLSTSRLHLLPGVGHFAPLEAPAELARIVGERLAEL